MLPVAVAASSCDREASVPVPESPDLSFVDREVKVPTGEVFELPTVDAPGDNAPDPKRCGRRTGRRADGSCEFLATRDAGYVQRVLLPQGRFVMGRVPPNYDGAPGRSRGAVQWPGAPPRYALAPSVWMDLHEVSREAYQACVAAGACAPAACPDGSDGLARAGDFEASVVSRLPQTCVTHDQAAAFCASHGGRLPTEVEWEYAARGVDGRTNAWGNDIRDEIGIQLVPTGLRMDESYFYLLGLSSSGSEWVADTYEADRGLAPFLDGSFRAPEGPLATALRAWETSFLCPKGQSACKPSLAVRRRHVAKGPTPAHVTGPYDSLPDGFAASLSAEGWAQFGPNPGLSFRCAADPSADDPKLIVPAEAPAIPFVARSGRLEVFGGAVAELVDQREAATFCRQLRNPGDGDEVRTGWRLPTVAEVAEVADAWRGPGPFWASDGAVVQGPAGWERTEAQASEALLARCVRG